MKRELLTTLLVLTLAASAAALNVSITPPQPDDITLTPEDNYSVAKQFDGTDSDGADSYSWTVEGASYTDSGPKTNISFDRTYDASNTVELVISNGTDTNATTVNQVLHDQPNISVSANTTSITVDDSVAFTSSVANSFDTSGTTYNWTVDGSQANTSTAFNYTFTTTGNHTVALNVTDGADNSDTANVTIEVTEPEGLTAVINPSSPSPVELNESNNYTTSKTFNASQSNNASSYWWNITETNQSATGVTASFSFNTSHPKNTTVELTASNGSTNTTTNVTQPITDQPNVSITVSDTSIQEGDTVTMNSSVTNTYDGNVSYNWTVDGSQKANTSDFTFTFNSAGDKTVKLVATDKASLSDQDSTTVSVNSTSDESDDESGSSGGGGGGGAAPAATDTDDEDTDENDTASDDAADQANDNADAEEPYDDADKTLSDALGKDIDVTAKADEASTEITTEVATFTAKKTTYETSQGNVSEITVDTEENASNASETIRVTIPKSSVNSTDELQGNFTVIKEDPVIELTKGSTVYVEANVDLSTWTFEPVTQTADQTEDEQAGQEDESTFFTSQVIAILILAVLILMLFGFYIIADTE